MIVGELLGEAIEFLRCRSNLGGMARF